MEKDHHGTKLEPVQLLLQQSSATDLQSVPKVERGQQGPIPACSFSSALLAPRSFCEQDRVAFSAMWCTAEAGQGRTEVTLVLPSNG